MENKFEKVRPLNKTRSEELFNGFIEITEKLDGANFSFIVDENDELIFRSRRQVLAENAGNFTKAVEYITKKNEQTPFEKGLIYFGECMTKHTIDYGATPEFVGFAVYSMEEEKYLDYWMQYFDMYNIPRVDPMIVQTISPDALEELTNKPSTFGTTCCIREGIVLKNYETQCFSKIVRPKFKEENKKIFGDPERKAKMEETDKIVATYCTPSRVQKGIFKLRDEDGCDVGMPMMEHLPILVTEDILEEEVLSIAKKFKDINFRHFRKGVAKECLKKLKEFVEVDWKAGVSTPA